MKRILSLFLLTLLFIVSAPIETSAQTKVTSNRYGLKIKLKNVVAVNKDVIVEGLLTNTDNSDMELCYYGWQSVAFDDEGNRYTRNIDIYLGDKLHESRIFIPAGTSLKYRIVIHNVDPAANILTYLNIYDIYSKDGVVFRNLAIDREEY